MKTIRVVAAIIKAVNENGEPIIFATQRGYGDFKGGWEFPGGKIEEGETSQEALIREIKEELDADGSPIKLIKTVEYDYPKFHVTIHLILCDLVSDHVVLKEHEDAKYIKKEDFKILEFLPADYLLFDELEKYL